RPPAPLVVFARGVISRLAVWPVLRVAVQENWGGPKSEDKRTWLASEIVDAFENQNPLPDDQYVEELLLQVMEDEFDCVVEDGSGEDVGRDIVKMWMESQVVDGKRDTIAKFEEMAEKMKGKKVDGEGEEDSDDDDWEDEDEGQMEVDEVPKLLDRGRKSEPEVDEDGFTLVKGKKPLR
ncbi:Pre-rRNA-processing protein TSR2-domain-containing protein, partial [Amanita rubescens]